MKSILVIHDSSLIRDFLEKQLTEYGFEVIQANNGLEGWMKIRQVIPDLVIMDYLLPRKSSIDILKSMEEDPNITDLPVVMTSSKLGKQQILEVARLGVKKILRKPIRIDALLTALVELLDVTIKWDDTPCILDAHLNDQILFVEIAKGFNREKINLLRYKVAELIRLYNVQDPKILILMTDIVFQDQDKNKLEALLEDAMNLVATPKRIRLLTVSEEIREYLSCHPVLKAIMTTKTLEEAMSGLMGIKGMESLTAEQDKVRGRFFVGKQEIQKETFQLNFAEERFRKNLSNIGNQVRVAVVDDDVIVQEIIKNTVASMGWEVSLFGVGLEFIESLNTDEAYDLLFLDLIMPEMNGFAVLQKMIKQGIKIPTIILTSLSRKESVIKARELGVNCYLIKPINPEEILAKAVEILGTDF